MAVSKEKFRCGHPKTEENSIQKGTKVDGSPAYRCRKCVTDRVKSWQHGQSRTWEIREWARKNGYDISPHGGRIPRAIQAAYDAAKARREKRRGVPY